MRRNNDMTETTDEILTVENGDKVKLVDNKTKNSCEQCYFYNSKLGYCPGWFDDDGERTGDQCSEDENEHFYEQQKIWVKVEE